ncbi:hypothetical protein C9940_04555 [Pseudidiomarina aestuarii]|uniref:Uncharacterized protein n=1 Tax=Pseudidiomarina aestuarii TaxID=624146 RepID=A0A2T4CWG9_9GAMM|nr:hypothetical protein C9940_04555 [Pseudidiomarina aestuarii]
MSAVEMKATSYQENTHSGKPKCDLLSFRRISWKKVQITGKKKARPKGLAKTFIEGERNIRL